MKLKHNILKHPAILSATKLVCAALSAAALFGTYVPSAPAPNDSGRFPIIAEPEIPQPDGTDETGNGQEISPQSDEEYADYHET